MMIKFVTGMKIKRANIMFLNLDNSVLEGYNSEKKFIIIPKFYSQLGCRFGKNDKRQRRSQITVLSFFFFFFYKSNHLYQT